MLFMTMTLNQKRNEGIQVTEGPKTQLRQAIGVGYIVLS
jgi:hypothetical protein